MTNSNFEGVIRSVMNEASRLPLNIWLLQFTIENITGFHPYFTPTPSNKKIPTLFIRNHAQTITTKGFAKVHKSAQFDIFALLFYKNGLMKQNFQL